MLAVVITDIGVKTCLPSSNCVGSTSATPLELSKKSTNRYESSNCFLYTFRMIEKSRWIFIGLFQTSLGDIPKWCHTLKRGEGISEIMTDYDMRERGSKDKCDILWHWGECLKNIENKCGSIYGRPLMSGPDTRIDDPKKTPTVIGGRGGLFGFLLRIGIYQRPLRPPLAAVCSSSN